MPIEKLTGRVAIVTGGAAGIGGEIARTLAADEAQVLIVDIDESTAAANVERIEAAGGKAATKRFHGVGVLRHVGAVRPPELVVLVDPRHHLLFRKSRNA